MRTDALSQSGSVSTDGDRDVTRTQQPNHSPQAGATSDLSTAPTTSAGISISNPATKLAQPNSLLLAINSQKTLKSFSEGTHEATLVEATHPDGSTGLYVAKPIVEGMEQATLELFTANLAAQQGIGPDTYMYQDSSGNNFIYSAYIDGSNTIDKLLPASNEEEEFLEYDITDQGNVNVKPEDSDADPVDTGITLTSESAKTLLEGLFFKELIVDNDIKLSNFVMETTGKVSGIDPGLAFQANANSRLTKISGLLDTFKAAKDNPRDDASFDRLNSALAMVLGDASTGVTVPFTKNLLSQLEPSDLSNMLYSAIDQFTNGGQFTNYTQALETTHNTLIGLGENPTVHMRSIDEGGRNYDQVSSTAQNLLSVQTEYAKSIKG